MLIFIEGIDKSGKTSFIKELSQVTGIPSYRKYLPKMNENEFHSYFKGIGYAMAELSNIFNFDLIVDRCFISDWIYSNRYSPNYNIEIWKEWECILDKENCLLLYFTISQSVFNYRIKLSKDIYMNEKDYDRYVSLYKLYLDETKIPTLVINGEDNINKQMKDLTSFISNKNRFYNTELYKKLVGV